MSLTFVRTPVRQLGYGTFGANLELGLKQIGVPFTTTPDAHITEVDPSSAVLWALPTSQMQWAWEGQYVAGFTMWEATRLPESFRDNFHEFDLMIVPCQQNVDLFTPYHDNVVKIPLGYNADEWVPAKRELNGEFRVLCSGAGLSTEGGRKGFDLAVQAFRLAFPDWEKMDPAPKLVTKSLRATNAPPYVETHVGSMTESQLVDLVHTCHAYLGPSRGEGWGYWPQQALATGIPTVLSGIPAHMEYAHLPGFHVAPVTSTIAAYFVYGPAGDWWECDVNVLADHLRNIYEDYEKHHAQALVGAEMMRREFSHRVMAERVASLLTPHFSREVTPVKRPFTRQVFPVEVNRRLTPADCTIGERGYNLVPGERYWLPADALRVIHDAGYLANELDNEPGKLPQEVAA